MRQIDRVWLFLLGPILFNFLVFMFSGWLGYIETASYEKAWKVAWVYRSLFWLILLWIFFYLLVREFKFKGKFLKDLIRVNRNSIFNDVALDAGLLFLFLLLWNAYTIPWTFIWPEFFTYFGEMPLTTSYIMFVIISSITAGLVEEVIWRGYGVTKLEEKYTSPKKAVAISSITWAVYHIDPFHIGIVLIQGIIYGYLYIRVRRLSPLIIGHTAFDIITFAFPQITMLLVS